jgi:uncharacterized protein involved in outer membrane biogenesis
VSKFAKRFLLGPAILLVALALILLCINLYLQSGGVQQRIRNAVSNALGVDLRIRSTSYTPWSGLVLRDITIPDPGKPESNVVEAAALRLRFSLAPLFQQRFVITECALFEPKFYLRQAENGDWIFPFFRRGEKAPAGPKEPAGPAVKGPSFKAELQRFRLGSGQIAFIDAKKRTVLLLEKSDINATVTPEMTVTGTATIGRMNVGNSLKPRRVGGPFTWDGRIFDMPGIQGSLAGGTLDGRFRLESGAAPGYSLAVQLNDVQLKRLVDDAGIEPGQTGGQLQGSLELAGDPRNSEATMGKGHFELVDAKLKPVEFLSKLGELFQIDELQLLQLSDAKINLTIADKRVQVDDVFLKSENLIIKGNGPIRFNGKIKLEARLLINQKLHRQLKGILGKNFKDSEDPEYRELPFTVTGNLSNPKTDLLDKLTGLPLGQNMGSFLQNILRAIPPQKSGDKKNEK